MSASSRGSGPHELEPGDLLQGTEPPPSVKRQDPYLGKTIDGRYLIEAALGEGGMGIVYRGRHKVIDKRVAIKVLKKEKASDHELTQRFLQEARAASAIGNPHIVDISDFGQMPDGATYFVMEFLDGRSLTAVQEELKPGPLPIPRLVQIGRQIAEALSAAHAAGIVHRDLKPDNVMLVRRGSEKDFVKLLDFGIAKVGSAGTGQTARLTRAGAVFGTPHYMSPEQAAGTPVDARTDLYSLGVMLYEMAAGKPPFDSENFMGIMTMHMYKQPAPIRALVPPPQDVPPGVEAIIMKCLSKRPELRYESADALILDLDRFAQGEIPAAVQDLMGRTGGFAVPADYFRHSQIGPAISGSPPSRRKPWGLYAGLAGVVTAMLLVGGIFAKSALLSARDEPKDIPVVATGPHAGPTAPPTGVPSATQAPQAPHLVAVAVDPSNAKVERDGTELQNPVVLELGESETATLKISRVGYTPQTVTVDGTEASRLIRLAPLPIAKPTAKPSATKGGSGEFVDLWKK